MSAISSQTTSPEGRGTSFSSPGPEVQPANAFQNPQDNAVAGLGGEIRCPWMIRLRRGVGI